MDLVSLDSLEVDYTPTYQKNNAKLERVIGCTAASRCSLSVDHNKGIVAYPAGATVVLHNPKNNAQAHLIGSTKNAITCLAFSPCGKYIVTGEHGHEPRIRVWELYDSSGQFAFSQISDIKYHQLGITCVRFTGGGTQVISIGNQHDRGIAVWDWRKGRKIAENRLTSRVNAMDENEQGSYVTVGVRHVKFWHLGASNPDDIRSVPLQGRSAILADHRNNTFVDVCCASNARTFSITETKMLVEFNDKKLVNTYDLYGETPYSLVMGVNELFIGFGNGTIRCFDAETVTHKRTYCKPHYMLCDVAKGVSGEALLPSSHPPDARYPDVRALAYNKNNGVMTSVYSDRSIYSWQYLPDGGAISKLSSQLSHVGPIFALETYPVGYSFLPPGSFITGGADETLRIWNVDQKTKNFDQENTSPLPQTNVYSEELKKTIYLTNDHNSLTETPDKVLAPSSMDVTTGAKSLRISPDGEHLACGGRDGNLRFYDLRSPDTPMIAMYEAHEMEVMCLEYSDPKKGERYLLASGSRDRLVHLFDPSNGYLPLASIDDHTSTVNSIVFATHVDDLVLLTCASDKMIVLRKMVASEPTSVRFDRTNQVTSQMGLNNMVMSRDGILTACQDRHLRTYSLQGKLIKQVKGALTDDGQLTKVRLDPSGTFAATVCTDRNVYVVEASTGECAAVLPGQSESVTDVAFSNDCRRVIVVSYSGCVFVWRLSNLLASKMNERIKKTAPVQSIATRAETPDSLLGSGSDAPSEEQPHKLAAQKGKDSESEFGSLNSVRIGDEDDDSSIGHKPARVVLSHSTEDAHNFELKRTATEVVRRSNSGILSQQNSAWDIASTANDFSDDEAAAVQQRGAATLRPVSANTYTSSRSMSNLRSPSMGQGSPRRPRKKWDMTGDAAYASPLSIQPNQPPPNGYGMGSGMAQNTAPLPSGFMTMNGTHIYHGPGSANKPPAPDALTNALLMSAINQQARQQVPPMQSVPQVMVRSPGMMSPPSHTPSKPTDLPIAPVGPFTSTSLSRTSPQRCSLTKKYILTTPGAAEPRTVWTPPAISTRRSTSNVHYSAPQAAGGPACLPRRPSELPNSPGGRLYQQHGSSQAGSEDGFRGSRRARTLHRLKNRRMTIANVEQGDNTDLTRTALSNLSNRKEDDYNASELHLRSRSQSPSQLALNALGDDYPRTHNRQDSDMSMYSTVTMTSTRLTPSSSRTNLRTVGLSNRQSSDTLNKLSQMRDKLRKSQENLAGAIGEDASTSMLMSRSKSIGNLRFSAAPAMGSSPHRTELPSSSCTPAASSPNGAADDSENLSDSPAMLSSSRQMARSVGSLHNNQEALDSSHEAYYTPATRGPTRLAQTIENLKKASNPDLTQLGMQEDLMRAAAEADSELIYAAATLPRNQRGKGAVQKRVERYHPRISRDTTSGESDSNASDANNSPLLQGASLTGAPMAPKRYFNTINGPNRSVSSVEGMPRPGMIQNARRIFEQQRHGATGAPRRAPSYLAQKLAGGDIVGPDMGAEECPRQPVSPCDPSGLLDFDGKSPQSKQMARHLNECLKQFNTGLDMILQARKLLVGSPQLPSDDRDAMLRITNQGIRLGRKRLDLADDRYEPDGGRSDSPNSITSQRQNTTQPSPSGGQQTTPTPVLGDMDANAFMQQHGHQLLAFLQHNMAKQN